MVAERLSKPDALRQRYALLLARLLVVLVSIAVPVLSRGILASSSTLESVPDYDSFYRPVAESILAGTGMALPDGSPAVRYPPGFPLLLAGALGLGRLVGAPQDAAVFALSLLGFAAATAMLFEIGRSLWGIRGGLMASLPLATYPFAVWLTVQPLSEVPFMAFLYGAVCLFWGAVRRTGRRSLAGVFLAGLLLGVAMLIRPIALLLPVALAMVLLAMAGSRRTAPARRALLVGALLLGSLLPALPWELYVLGRTGQVIALSTGGVPGLRDGLTFASNSKSYRQGFWIPEGARAVTQRAMTQLYQPSGTLTVGAFLREELASNPGDLLQLMLVKLARCFYGTDSGRLEGLIALAQVPYLALLALSGFAGVRAGGDARWLSVTLLALLAVFWGMSLAALSILRYMVPAIGLLFALLPALQAIRPSSCRSRAQRDPQEARDRLPIPS